MQDFGLVPPGQVPRQPAKLACRQADVGPVAAELERVPIVVEWALLIERNTRVRGTEEADAQRHLRD